MDSVELNKTEIYRFCVSGRKVVGSDCPADMMVGVTTKATDADNDTLIYSYKITGGRIEGQGANVKWDLSGVEPGTYEITAEVDDGCGVCGKTVTGTVTVKECVSCIDNCECYAFAVERGAENVKQGQSVTFTVSVSGGNVTVDKYYWTVDHGEIIKGQGTTIIKVRANKAAGTIMTATVELGGAHKCLRICPTVASDSVMETDK